MRFAAAICSPEPGDWLNETRPDTVFVANEIVSGFLFFEGIIYSGIWMVARSPPSLLSLRMIWPP